MGLKLSCRRRNSKTHTYRQCVHARHTDRQRLKT